ncbi:uncharacterized protein LOC130867194 isoform X2 [Chionomys nivalis]|uniref:uncharacterized protein LOC130867194 isoform X2 n=1 Tax=Chionomys nivalis TaxID=269649 RepID=UPI002592E325|nr:uncharacterized protein LOC130867194 isoform X2 [Chionomys nivalis]
MPRWRLQEDAQRATKRPSVHRLCPDGDHDSTVGLGGAQRGFRSDHLGTNKHPPIHSLEKALDWTQDAPGPRDAALEAAGRFPEGHIGHRGPQCAPVSTDSAQTATRTPPGPGPCPERLQVSPSGNKQVASPPHPSGRQKQRPSVKASTSSRDESWCHSFCLGQTLVHHVLKAWFPSFRVWLPAVCDSSVEKSVLFCAPF